MKLSDAFTNLDRDVVKYLKGIAGKQLANSELAKHFDVTEVEMRTALERQVKSRNICAEISSGRRKFFVPVGGIAEEAAAVANAEPRYAFPVYVPPQPLMELYARIRREREAIPSKFDS